VLAKGGQVNHIRIILSITLLLLAGCGGTLEVAAPTERVEIVSMTPLPPVAPGSHETGMRLNFLIHILQDGTVENVRMLGSSGNSEWDSLAMQSIRQWRYAPFRRDGVPVDLWFRQLVMVQIQEPIILTIGELVFSTLREADSLYALLGKGTNLDSLFRQDIGTFDIAKYPKTVRDALRSLPVGGYTSPLRRGEEYVIYKRFKEGAF
jgi:TonB family protein